MPCTREKGFALGSSSAARLDISRVESLPRKMTPRRRPTACDTEPSECSTSSAKRIRLLQKCACGKGHCAVEALAVRTLVCRCGGRAHLNLAINFAWAAGRRIESPDMMIVIFEGGIDARAAFCRAD